MKIKENEKVYIALNKPSGFVSALKDNLHPTIIELIKEKHKGLHIVGRLDKDTTGLIILTNDGELTHRLTSPKKEVSKTYLVELKNRFSDSDKETIENGMSIDHGTTKLKPGKVKIINHNTIELTIKEGKFHQVKKMMFAIDNEVIKLKRIAIGGLKLSSLELKEKEYKMIEKNKIFYNTNNE